MPSCPCSLSSFVFPFSIRVSLLVLIPRCAALDGDSPVHSFGLRTLSETPLTPPPRHRPTHRRNVHLTKIDTTIAINHHPPPTTRHPIPNNHHQPTTKHQPPSSPSYSSAIMACSASGQWEPAVALLREMSQRGLSPSRTSYAPAIKACGQGDNPNMALSLLREMSEVGWDVWLVLLVIFCFRFGYPARRPRLSF